MGGRGGGRRTRNGDYAPGPRRLQPAHHQASFSQKRGDLGDVGQRRVPFGHVAGQVLECRALVLRVALLGVQLDQLAGLLKLNGRDLERGRLGAGEAPGCEGALESCAGRLPRSRTYVLTCGGERADLPPAPVLMPQDVGRRSGRSAPLDRMTRKRRRAAGCRSTKSPRRFDRQTPRPEEALYTLRARA